MNDTDIDWRIIEAILFRSSQPVHENQLKTYMETPDNLKNILNNLREFYQYRGVILRQAGKHWSFITSPALGDRIKKAENKKNTSKESPAFSEILAIIAYHQPITRSEISTIRGTECSSDILSRMLSYGWIKTLGKKDSIGRPMLWGTTDAFLHHFGFESLNNLPSVEELQQNGLMTNSPEPIVISDENNHTSN